MVVPAPELGLVAPITHAEPAADQAAMEIPAPVKRRLGLDDARSWVVVDELNEFVWPGHDLSPDREGKIAYGFIPPSLYERIRRMVLEGALAGRLARIPR